MVSVFTLVLLPLILLSTFKSPFMFLQPSFTTWASCLVFESLLSPMFVLHSSLCMPAACIESMFILIILSAAVSGITSSAWPFLGTTKIHIFLLSLKLMVTMQVPNCVMTVLLYVFNFMCLLMVFWVWLL